ncbi:thiol-disulfide oxidoreductase DCC family protein [Methylotuvimicrobium sp. KM1]|uniref:thiol-disulfide oxidoreductase DCC family protein n=1 Tax=Methylotuvimicrobium sp. KM1 TaxID=3377707 RepID=UPI00384C5059
MPENYEPSKEIGHRPTKLVVYYDGACPKCIRDRRNYEKLAGRHANNVYWFDITGQEKRLQELGIDPEKALMELHVSDANGRVVSELDAYILLMKKVPLLKPVAWLISLPLIRPFLANLYHRQVNRRLQKRGLL